MKEVMVKKSYWKFLKFNSYTSIKHACPFCSFKEDWSFAEPLKDTCPSCKKQLVIRAREGFRDLPYLFKDNRYERDGSFVKFIEGLKNEN